MIQPLSQRVVLTKTKEEERKIGGLLLPSSAKSADNIAKVIAVGSDVDQINIDDVVVFDQYDNLHVDHNGEEFIIVKVENIAAIIK